MEQRKKKVPQTIILQRDCHLEEKCFKVCQTLSNLADKLSDIDVLDFQCSDFKTISVFEFCRLYANYGSMKNIPIIGVEDCFSHDDFQNIISELLRKEEE